MDASNPLSDRNTASKRNRILYLSSVLCTLQLPPVVPILSSTLLCGRGRWRARNNAMLLSVSVPPPLQCRRAARAGRDNTRAVRVRRPGTRTSQHYAPGNVIVESGLRPQDQSGGGRWSVRNNCPRTVLQCSERWPVQAAAERGGSTESCCI